MGGRGTWTTLTCSCDGDVTMTAGCLGRRHLLATHPGRKRATSSSSSESRASTYERGRGGGTCMMSTRSCDGEVTMTGGCPPWPDLPPGRKRRTSSPDSKSRSELAKHQKRTLSAGVASARWLVLYVQLGGRGDRGEDRNGGGSGQGEDGSATHIERAIENVRRGEGKSSSQQNQG